MKFLTMHGCKGTLVMLPGGGWVVDEGRKDEEARLLYVTMTRATNQVIAFVN